MRVELACAADGVFGRVCAGVGDPPAWIVDNKARTLVAGSSLASSASSSSALGPFGSFAACFDLRSPTGLPGDDVSGPSGASNKTDVDADETDKGRTGHSASLGRSSGRVFGASGRRAFGDDAPATATVVEFTRVWWDFNSGARSRLSVWRPTCPPGLSPWETSPSPSCSRPRPRWWSRCAGSIGDDAGIRTRDLPWRGP